MVRSIAKVMLSGLLLFSLGLPIHANAQQASAAITIDASRIDNVLTLSDPFPTQTADELRFSDPGFDDTGWPRLKPNQPLSDAHLSSARESYAWVRVRLRILNAQHPLAVAIGHRFYAYTVYVNGRQVASSKGMASLESFYDPPFAIALPSSENIILAIRFHNVTRLTRSPLAELEIGSPWAVTAATKLERIRDFDSNQATPLLLALTLVAFTAFSLVLFLAQRHRAEYLWLALYCFCLGGYLLVNVGRDTGTFSLGMRTGLLIACFGLYSDLCGLEFVIRFVRAKPSWPLRLVEATLLLGPLMLFLPFNAAYISAPAQAVWFVALGYFLVKAYGSGDVENKLLLPPFALFALTGAWAFAPQIFPGIYFPKPFQIGRLGVNIDQISLFLFLAGILAVVLYRFIRVTRDEQRAAAELEAARTIQMILIPETPPTIPGYTIASVYQPALQVGGDFFQIIPLATDAALVILGDVSGKGMQAAMTVSLLVGAVRAAAETTTSPAELLANLNRRVQGRGTGFTTCLILRIDASGNITASNAGHLQPYLEGRELVLEPSLPLGFLPECSYPESQITLAPGQTLTLLTDGIVEARSLSRELFGFERTQSISRQTAQQIAAAATAFGNPAPQADDITVLTLERLPA